jgi:branched-chain amino acid transport system permease protein
MDLDILLQALLLGLFNSSVYALVALGLTLIFGVMDIADFAQGALYMLGAYAVYYTSQLLGMPYFVGLGAAALGVAAVGVLNYLLVYRPLHRVGGATTFIAALGILLILENLASFAFGADFRRTSSPFGGAKLTLAGAVLTYHQLFTIAMTGALLTLVWLFLQRTRMGKALRAMSQNREAAALVGIGIHRVALVTFALAAALAGGAGALVSPIRAFNPTMGGIIILKSFAVVIFGGMGSVQGALVGALIIGLTETLVAAYFAAQYSDLVAFALMIGILFVRPQGLFGGGRP